VIASVKTAGLIGDKYINLSPGGSEDILEPGDAITDTVSALDIEELIGRYAFGSVEE
jgi:phospholipid/cholesterol/gamma-HCH transport system substrate-binding protein